MPETPLRLRWVVAGVAVGAILAISAVAVSRATSGSSDGDTSSADVTDSASTASPGVTPAPTPAPTATPAPAHRPTAAAAAPRTAPPAGPVNVGPVYAVGDSVTIDISPPLHHDVPAVTVDGQVGRQFSTGISIISGLHAAGRLPPTVVVALGTNGTVTPQQIDAMMSAASGARKVVFVTVHVPRIWQDSDNSVIRAGVARHSNAALADWFALSAGHPAWFAADGYHLTPAGASALAGLIASTL